MSKINGIELSGRRSGCRVCGKVFTCPSSFDKHRVGKYDISAPKFGRSCLLVDDLPDWTTNRHGLWFKLDQRRPYYVRGSNVGDAISHDR